MIKVAIEEADDQTMVSQAMPMMLDKLVGAQGDNEVSAQQHISLCHNNYLTLSLLFSLFLSISCSFYFFAHVAGTGRGWFGKVGRRSISPEAYYRQRV